MDGENNVSISNITVNKTGDSDGGDNTSFYGINSAILAKGGTNLILSNITVTTDATGANGGIVTLNMTNQTATGNIVIDSISTLDMSMKTNSYY